MSYQDDVIYPKNLFLANFFADLQLTDFGILRLSSKAAEIWTDMLCGCPINKFFLLEGTSKIR